MRPELLQLLKYCRDTLELLLLAYNCMPRGRLISLNYALSCVNTTLVKVLLHKKNLSLLQWLTVTLGCLAVGFGYGHLGDCIVFVGLAGLRLPSMKARDATLVAAESGSECRAFCPDLHHS